MTALLTLSKLDVAKRQLEIAIRLYFTYGDPVSIHTLAAAGYNVLRDLTEKRGAEPMFLKGLLLDNVRPEYKDQVIRKLNEAENFFKHADRDHASTLEFKPELSEFHLLDACWQYEKLAGEWPPILLTFKIWFMVIHPEMFNFPSGVKDRSERGGFQNGTLCVFRGNFTRALGYSLSGAPGRGRNAPQDTRKSHRRGRWRTKSGRLDRWVAGNFESGEALVFGNCRRCRHFPDASHQGICLSAKH